MCSGPPDWRVVLEMPPFSVRIFKIIPILTILDYTSPDSNPAANTGRQHLLILRSISQSLWFIISLSRVFPQGLTVYDHFDHREMAIAPTAQTGNP